MIRRLIVFVIVLLMTVPAAIIMTILAMPFFAWIEARFGVEAVGHSGPLSGATSVCTSRCLRRSPWVRSDS
jgi:hypothetical protein